MAAIWPASRVPFLDESGDPMVGAKLYFYDTETTTPQPVYEDSSLSIVRSQPILADARGMFPVIFLNPTPGVYRQKLLEADDTLVFDDDGIDVPQAATYVPPEAGETAVELLFRTGMLQNFYGTSSPSGWVRAAGRTIGSATSGATERANADCEDLFLHLWGVDSTLSVSGGRGGTAAGDWASNKSIALPDFRGRALVGLDTMGNSAAGVLTGIETLGEATGAESVTLDTTQIPTHLHAAGTLLMPNHGHAVRYSASPSSGSDGSGGIELSTNGDADYAANTDASPGTDAGKAIAGSGTASITGSTANAGSGGSHSNVQPSRGVTIIIKL